MSTAAARRRPRPDSAPVTALLAGLAAMAPLSVDMPLPALPRIADGLGAEVAATQLVISAFLLGFAVAQLAYGPLSDRYGRRPVVLGGLALYLVAGIACAVAPSIDWMIGGRFAQGLGACAAPVVARAVVRDLHDGVRAARILSLLATGMSLAPILAPIVGAYVVIGFDWRAVFVVLALSAAVLIAATGTMLGETNRGIGGAPLSLGRMLANYWRILTLNRFAVFAVPIGGLAAGLLSFLSGAPFVLIQLYGVGADGFALCFAIVMAGQISGAILSARLGGRLGVERAVLVGLGIAAAGGVLLAGLAWAGVTGVAAFIGPMAVFMLGNGFLQPNATAGALQPFPHIAGSASALIGFIQFASGALAGVLMGHLYNDSARPVATMICFFSLLAGLGHIVVRRAGRGTPAHPGATP
jgi:DHA1 family bicyclomycin/chloramphenicol resistance-like MFS transporter